MNKGPLILLGFVVGIVGYALLYSGLTKLNPSISPTGAYVGTMDALVPGKVVQKAAA